MATTKQLIEASLRTIGVLASGEQAKPAEIQDAILTATQLLASWSNEGLLVNALTHEEFTLTGQGSYSIGVGGDINTIRPTTIENVRIRDAAGTETPIKMVSMNIWADVSVKNIVEYAPDFVYYEPSYPLGILKFSGIPVTGDILKLITVKPITDLPALTAETSFPPGYERAIRLGLALELAPEYGRNIDQLIVGEYRQAISSLKRTNARHRTRTLKVDPAMLRGRSYDINKGPE